MSVLRSGKWEADPMHPNELMLMDFAVENSCFAYDGIPQFVVWCLSDDWLPNLEYDLELFALARLKYCSKASDEVSYRSLPAADNDLHCMVHSNLHCNRSVQIFKSGQWRWKSTHGGCDGPHQEIIKFIHFDPGANPCSFEWRWNLMSSRVVAPLMARPQW